MNYPRFLLLTILFFTISKLWAEPRAKNCDDWLWCGHNYLTQHRVLDARDSFYRAWQESNTNEEANFMLGITRIAALAYLDITQNLMDRFGISTTDRDIYHWTADFQRDINGNIILPNDSPSGVQVQEFLTSPVLSECMAALDNFRNVSATFNILLPAEEIGLTTSTLAPATEFDYGDVCLAKSALCATIVGINIIKNYNVDLDIDYIVWRAVNNPSNIVEDIKNSYPALLTFITAEPQPFQSLRPIIEEAVNNYFTGIRFIHAETDDQSDDFITFYPEDEPNIREFDNIIEGVRNSLNGETQISAFGYDFRLNLVPFIEGRLELRNFVPHFNENNLPDINTLPDPTFAGLCNAAPRFKFIFPDELYYTSSNIIPIVWEDFDLEDNASISLFYNGNLMVSGISEDDETDWYLWDVSTLPENMYTFIASISDGKNPTQYADSVGTVTLNRVSEIDFASALDNSSLYWFTGGDALWRTDPEVVLLGTTSARSGGILDGKESKLVTVVKGPGRISFYWKVSSELYCDWLEFYIDDELRGHISGEKDWQFGCYYVGTGNHILRWVYTKNLNVAEGKDCGWIDGVEWISPPPPQRVIYIPNDYPTIQEAINDACEGDEIIVSPGTYYENINFWGKNVVLRSQDPTNPDVVATTIIDGSYNGSVVTFDGTEPQNCFLQGFIITNGHSPRGGGINGNGTLATIQYNNITTNTVYGFYPDGSGGGLFNCSGTIQNNTITGNSATNYGGGFFNCGGTIQNNTITGNSASDSGGGLYYCDGTIQNNIIAGNSANYGGGLYYCGGTIRNNTITGNSATNYGGGLYYCGGTIQNNTIAGNSANSGGGLFYCDGFILNCIIWGDSAATGSQIDELTTPVFSCIQNWEGGGEGNIKDDPIFVNLLAGDFHLTDDSPCIDAGHPNSQYNDRCLPPGKGTVRNDMGAYGGPQNCFTPTPTPFVPRPHLVNAIFSDANNNGSAEPGEALTLVFDQGVTITQSLITPDCFYLPVAGDSLGLAGFSASINPYSSRELILILGQGAHLTIEDDFFITMSQSGSPSGIDLSVDRPPFAIRSLDGLVDSIDLGVPNSNDTGLDIKYSFKPVTGDIGSDGGTLDNSCDPDAAYQYSLYIPGGSLSSVTQFTIKSPDIPSSPPGCDTSPLPGGAIQILANADNIQFLTSATLTLEYLDSDVNTDMGFAEAGMRVNMYVQGEDGCWHWVPVPGEQIVDTERNTVTVHLWHLAGATGGMRLASPGDSGIYGNLPGSTVEESTVNIKPQGEGMVRILVGQTLNAGAGGFYTWHQIEFPNYVVTDPSDPNVIKVSIKQATLADRIARSGGNSFPTASNALFIILTKNFSNVGVPFNSPVNIRVQFMDGTANAFNDIWTFDNTAGTFGSMALVKGTVTERGVNFQFIQGVTQSVTHITGGGYVEGLGITGLTGSVVLGKGVWGAVSNPSLPTPEKIKRYLLGLNSDKTGLDLNGDGKVDIADLVWYLIGHPQAK